ncbi:rhodanese-like domain-containing protein [Thioalkalivibrio sp. XN8]|uniref:rhodanese-like domain-containing protein n=1 Tax=Thioalkalivibrio sp. XN8 TaxID=2712863 RepID=UPI0013E9EA38|nr:rhodanese-like domain-containing protein [Thioalkalivibrio sp. XN8]NGP52067.1 rhodanese-like domain-containing protein [Thioalkalivibrio sp. XN8]
MEAILQYAAAHPLLFGGLLLMFAVVFGYEMRVARRKGTDISPPEAVALINAGAQPVDVRAAAQFEKAHILDARNIPAGDLDQHVAALEKLQERGILLYCDSGSASLKVAETLKAKGLTGIRTLRGGLNAWRADNLPVFSGRKARKKDSA